MLLLVEIREPTAQTQTASGSRSDVIQEAMNAVMKTRPTPIDQ
jgi:hypothetical protein